MSDAKGYLVVPIARRPDGSIHAFELTVNDFLRVNVENTNLMETPHALLDGAINLDTVTHAPVKGDVIIGIDQGAGVIKWKALARGTTGQALTVQADGTLAWETPASAMESQILLIDQKAQNTNGGTFTSGAWRTRDINTEVYDTGNHASIVANQIILLAGTYRCFIDCPAYDCDGHVARLQNITDGTTIVNGTSQYASPSGNVQNSSIIHFRFTIADTKTFEIQHRCITTSAMYGFGSAANLSTETYTTARFWREA